MSAIFILSSQTGTESEEVSGFVRKAIEAVLYRYVKMAELNASTINLLETMVRKTAHLFIYFCLGFSVIATFLSYGAKRNVFLKAAVFCFLYAVSDETHQYFVEGRAAEVTDVLLDAAGSLAGIIFHTLLTGKIIFRRRNKKPTV